MSEQVMRNYLISKGETVNLWEVPDVATSTTIKPTGSYAVEGLEFDWEDLTVQMVFVGTSASELETRMQRVKSLLLNATSAELSDGVAGFKLMQDKWYMGKDTKARTAFTMNWLIMKNI